MHASTSAIMFRPLSRRTLADSDTSVFEVKMDDATTALELWPTLSTADASRARESTVIRRLLDCRLRDKPHLELEVRYVLRPSAAWLLLHQLLTGLSCNWS